MANSILQMRLRANVADAIGQARAVADLEHAASKGTFREIAVHKLLGPLLRSGVGITSGIVVDSDGSCSPQMDVIVYSTDVLPPVMVEAAISVVPIEACIQVFEVKSRLTAEELKKSLRAASAMNRLCVVPPGPADALEALRGRNKNDPHINVPTVFSIFAFDTDIKDKPELERVREVAEAMLDEHDKARVLLHDLCVVGRGYWRQPLDRSTCEHVDPSDSYDEVVEQLLAATDSWPVWIGTRRNTRLRPYFE